jgi:chromosome segregation ATPase
MTKNVESIRLLNTAIVKSKEKVINATYEQRLKEIIKKIKRQLDFSEKKYRASQKVVSSLKMKKRSLKGEVDKVKRSLRNKDALNKGLKLEVHKLKRRTEELKKLLNRVKSSSEVN